MSLVALLLLGALPDGGTALPFDRRMREIMHTEVTISLPGNVPTEQRERLFREAFGVFEQIDATLNEWRDDSALSKVNAGAGGPPVAASPMVCDVVRLALDGARRTNGLFDPTWAALRDVWKFGSDETGEVPSPALVAERCPLVSWKDVELKPSKTACTIRLPKRGMKLGLGGLAKGWGVDQVVHLLGRAGLTDFFVQAGGDLYVAGNAGDHPWRVGIRDPRGPKEALFAKLQLTDSAFSTSGDYEHFFIKNGTRYHHLIDPRTCWPATASVSVTVLARSATDAEFLTKAAFILGPLEGQKLLREFKASAVWVTPTGEIRATEGLGNALQDVWPPSGFARDGGSPTGR